MHDLAADDRYEYRALFKLLNSRFGNQGLEAAVVTLTSILVSGVSSQAIQASAGSKYMKFQVFNIFNSPYPALVLLGLE